MQMVKGIAKSSKNLKSRIKFYSDLKKKKQLALRINVKWKLFNLKYGSHGITDKLASKIKFSMILST